MGKDDDGCIDGCNQFEYSLKGPQVEPSAGLWQYCTRLRIVGIDEMRALTDKKNDPHYFPPYPVDTKTLKLEIDELLDLQKHRDDPCYLSNPKACDKVPEVCEFEKGLPAAYGCRKPISKLWNLCPYPLGGVLVNRFPGNDVIRTGRGLARAVENETPGLYHRHIASFLMKTRNWSPPRQSLVWAALDIAIASALQAAWYYKWVAEGRNKGECTAYRERPIEYSLRNNSGLTVLFDHPDELNPSYIRCPDALDPNTVSPGTPRHPAYPSGHSTYSAAGSEILKFFFGEEDTPAFLGSANKLKTEFDYLADNIGLGRMWAGVHWRSDHEAGQKLGRTIACLVLRQLASMRTADADFRKVITFNLCPPDPKMPCNNCDPKDKVKPCNNDKPPKRPALCKLGGEIHDQCPECAAKDDTDPGKPCPAPPPPCPKEDPCEPKNWSARVDAYRGPQQGGGS
jgi:membrane-associated phospholipid phosphatase